MRMRFEDLAVGTSFVFNGNFCTKTSTRTAVLVQYMRTFYFRKSDIVEV